MAVAAAPCEERTALGDSTVPVGIHYYSRTRGSDLSRPVRSCPELSNQTGWMHV
jgi:hypothetical protein